MGVTSILMTPLAMEHWHEAIEIMNVWMACWQGREVGRGHPSHHLWLNHYIGSSTITIPSLHFYFYFKNSFWFPMLKKIQKLQRKVSNFESQFLDVWKSHKHKTSLLFITKWISLMVVMDVCILSNMCVSSMVVLHVIYSIFNPTIN
jgi:hypothetical protein